MYFTNRIDAASQLLSKLEPYKNQQAIVIALNISSIEMSRYIADSLGGRLTLLISRQIGIPGEGTVVGSVNQEGEFDYSKSLSEGEINSYVGEFHNFIESEKLTDVSDIHRLLRTRELIDRHQFKNKTVILVADGIGDPTPLDVADEYLKPIKLGQLVVATPIVSIPCLDRIHILADKVYVLSVLSQYLDTNHYYSINQIDKSPQELMEMLDK